MVSVDLPGRYFEIESFPNGTIEIERFVSTGVDDGSPSDLEEILGELSS